MSLMKYPIDPSVDYVFKNLFGVKNHAHLLIDFVNCVLTPKAPICKVEILNPLDEQTNDDGALSVVNIHAIDAHNNAMQVEIQLTSPGVLKDRMMHNWSSLYHQQFSVCKSLNKLKPVHSIWLLTETLFKDHDDYHSHFQPWDKNANLLLTEQMSIHVLELSKWRKPKVLKPLDKWLYFFKYGKRFLNLPLGLKGCKLMEQALDVLKDIAEKEQSYYRYLTHEIVLRHQKSEQHKRDEMDDLKDKLLLQANEIRTLKAKLEDANIEAQQWCIGHRHH